jgi:hypothetical protein
MGLTIAQVEAISAEVGLPSSRWGEADHWSVMAVVYAVVEDIPVAEAKAMTVAQLSSRMYLMEDEESADPTQASG